MILPSNAKSHLWVFINAMVTDATFDPYRLISAVVRLVGGYYFNTCRLFLSNIMVALMRRFLPSQWSQAGVSKKIRSSRPTIDCIKLIDR